MQIDSDLRDKESAVSQCFIESSPYHPVPSNVKLFHYYDRKGRWYSVPVLETMLLMQPLSGYMARPVMAAAKSDTNRMTRSRL